MKMKNFIKYILIFVVITCLTSFVPNNKIQEKIQNNTGSVQHKLQDYPKIPAKKIPAKKIPRYSFTLYRISAYTNSVQETDSTPYNTACGHVNDVKYRPIIAVSRDIFFYKGYKWLCGKTARITYSDGTYIEGVIYDTMNSRYRNTADVLIRKNTLTKARAAAFQHGVKTGKLHIY